MDPSIAKELLSFQVAHVLQLDEALKGSNCILDASDTGTGKTYCAIALCKIKQLEPFIICPKSVINTWADVCKKFNVNMRGIANYEMLKGGKYYTNDFERIDCPYFDKIKVGEKIDFIFQLPIDTLVIFDEAHRCKNHKTSTSKLLLSAQTSGIKVLLLSATLADKLIAFSVFGTVFGLYNGIKKFNDWMRKQMVINKIKYANKNLDEEQIKLDIIHKTLFPKYGSRMKIKELGDLFPKNNIISQCYYMENYNEIDKLYDEINLAMEELKNKETRADGLGKIIRARQRIELLKVPVFVDIAEEALDNGYSVAIFVNFTETLYNLCHHLNSSCIIMGGQSTEERDTNIKDFQNNKEKVIVAMIQAGGVGVSLHDLYGRPRMSVISPPFSGIMLQQTLGRIFRAGSKSPAIQKIVYCAKSYEERICEIIKTKLKTISTINDGDLVGPKISMEKINQFNEYMNKGDESETWKAPPPPKDKVNND
ncbi:MAG: DEXDc helicase [Terrestrivirus sp.]|uniref:DEXDc helicase n=1 Tax=Terrestrivirus sp. TaxID=2487775 RepID=A0A3G4ZNX3_9VIRU|nr:MAG: DEXDc helicase [Terrestrivirus sp.]